MDTQQKLKVFTGFAGYGGDKFALQLANLEYEEIGFSEIDKYAIQCHEQNHKGKNFGSITEINPNEIPDFDLFTGGFPCQAFSIAGKGQGVNDEKGRGLLFNHIIRICEVKKPKYILLENVKGLMSKKHSEFFEFTKSELKRIGYNIDVSLYNSKNYGIPQNRERVFYVCIRDDLEFKYDKPIAIQTDKKIKTLDPLGNKISNVPSIGQASRIYDKTGLLPALNVGWTPLVLSDILETDVDEKYFLSDEQVKKLLFRTKVNISSVCEPTAFDVYNKKLKTNGLVPTLTEPHHNSLRLVIKNATTKGYVYGYEGDGISLEFPDSKTRRGRVQEQISPTLQCNGGKGVIVSNLRIRKFTPIERFRLMGFDQDQINLDGLSDNQKDRLSGNGWEINLVSKIMRGFLSLK